MSFLIVEILLLIGIIICLLLLSGIWPPDSPWSPWWKTTKEVARVIQKLAKIKKSDLLYELGSGDGENLITLAREFDIKSVGVEIDPLRAWHSKWRVKQNKLSSKVTIVKQNFFAVDLSPADVVYFYLVPKAIMRLKEKIITELKEGTRVVSYRYEVPYLTQIGFNKEHILYLYEVPKATKKK